MTHRFLQNASYYLRRTLRLKDRYLYTRDRRLRLRVVAMPAMGCMAIGLAMGLSMAAAGGVLPSSLTGLSSASANSWAQALAPYRDEDGQIRRGAKQREIAQLVESAPTGPQSKIIRIAKGDTVAQVLQRAGVSGSQAAEAVREISRHVNPRAIRAGQKMDIRLEPNEDSKGLQLAHVSMALDPLRTVVVEQNDEGFSSTLHEKEVTRQTFARTAVIDASVYESAARAGVPNSVTAQAIRLFSHNVDFQRDIHSGDRMEVYYDAMITEDGYVAKGGDILFARLTLSGKTMSLYRNERNGLVDYFDEQGRSFKKALLSTPIDGARITSGFGMRMHPLLGYTKMHKGVDFGAPIGTPIYAAGDGTIDKLGWVSGYGKYIRIRHNGNIQTAYAHMSRFASTSHVGGRVKQGQLIGYVGTTGRSTGPHLHYEVLLAGAQVNPKSQTKLAGQTLTGKDLRKFKEQVARLQREFTARKAGLKLVSSAGSSATPATEKDRDL